MATDQLVNKALKQIDFKIRHNGNGSGSGGESSIKSNLSCHKCGKKGHIKKYCRSKGNGSSGNSPRNYANELPKWFTKKPIVSYNK